MDGATIEPSRCSLMKDKYDILIIEKTEQSKEAAPVDAASVVANTRRVGYCRCVIAQVIVRDPR